MEAGVAVGRAAQALEGTTSAQPPGAPWASGHQRRRLSSRLRPSDPPALPGSPEVSHVPSCPAQGCDGSGPGVGVAGLTIGLAAQPLGPRGRVAPGRCGRQADWARCLGSEGPAGWLKGGGARGPDLLPLPRRLLLLGGRAGMATCGHRAARATRRTTRWERCAVRGPALPRQGHRQGSGPQGARVRPLAHHYPRGVGHHGRRGPPTSSTSRWASDTWAPATAT